MHTKAVYAAVVAVLLVCIVVAFAIGRNSSNNNNAPLRFAAGQNAPRQGPIPPVCKCGDDKDSVPKCGAHTAETAPAPACMPATAGLAPEDIAEAEREAWQGVASEFDAGGYNPERANDAASDAMQHHERTPQLDYGAYLSDMVIDPRTRQHHQEWVKDMKPWSQTSTKIAEFDIEPSVDFLGLRRPQAVYQSPSALFVTERDATDFADNPKFNFRG